MNRTLLLVACLASPFALACAHTSSEPSSPEPIAGEPAPVTAASGAASTSGTSTSGASSTSAAASTSGASSASGGGASSTSGSGASSTSGGGASSASGGGASSAGANGAPLRTPEKMCGGIAGIRCPEKQFCAYAPEARCGAGDMSGTCRPKPDMCTQHVDEVCGCDDRTYSNACMAAQRGVSIAMKGACAPGPAAGGIPEGKLCGTRGVPGECKEGLYCAYKRDCGATDSGGTCSKKTQMCTKIYKPVCGCDGKTYGNACTAAGAGVTVASQGECKKAP